MREDVDPRCPGTKRSLEQPLDVIPELHDVIKVRPLEFPRRCKVEQELVRAELSVSGGGPQSVQSVDDREVALVVDGDESGPHERCVGSETGQERSPRDAEKARECCASHIEGLRHSSELAPALEDAVDQRLDDWVHAVSEQDLEDREVGSGELHLVSETPQALRHPVRTYSSCAGAANFAEDIAQYLPLVLGESELGFPVPSPLSAKLVCLSRESKQIAVLHDPLGEFPCLGALVLQACDGVREVGADEVSFVGCEHCFLRLRGGSEVG